MGVNGFDGISNPRNQDEPVYDVFLAGPVFMDIVFSGMRHAPVLGTETWAEVMGSCPGGIANIAVALSRLGLSTSLATAFGDDAYGDFCRDSLELAEGIELSRSVRMTGRHTPLTISLAYDGDRTMVSHGHINEHPEVTDELPVARAVFVSLGSGKETRWLAPAKAGGARVIANSGWDDTGQWDLTTLEDLPLVDVFVTNEVEALLWTKTADAACAAMRLAENVGLAVVTRGAAGALAVDAATRTVTEVGGIGTPAIDPTGAGDVFVAGLMAGFELGCTVREALTIGAVAAGLSVQRIGGSLSAPVGEELRTWYERHDERGQHRFESDYGFLRELFPPTRQVRRTRRAVPTVGFRPHTADHSSR